MLTVTITDTSLETRLRERAAAHGHSPEDEAQNIIGAALQSDVEFGDLNLGQALHQAFAEVGGAEIDVTWLRKLPGREPPTFE